MDPIESLLKEYSHKYKVASKSDIKIRFELLNLIIQLELQNPLYQELLYQHIKIWMNLYIRNLENNQISYDEIVFDKVINIVDSLDSIDKKIKIIKFFIRLLKKNFIDENLLIYDNYCKNLELKKLAISNKSLEFLFKEITKDLHSIIITLVISLLIFSYIIFLGKVNIFDIANGISLNFYSSNIYINCIVNLLSIIFSIGEDVRIENTIDFIYILFIKFYFYFLISYFVTKKITQKLDKA